MRVILWKGSCRLAHMIFSTRNLVQHTPTPPCVFPQNGIFCHQNAIGSTFQTQHCQIHDTMVVISQLNCCYGQLQSNCYPQDSTSYSAKYPYSPYPKIIYSKKPISVSNPASQNQINQIYYPLLDISYYFSMSLKIYLHPSPIALPYCFIPPFMYPSRGSG